MCYGKGGKVLVNSNIPTFPAISNHEAKGASTGNNSELNQALCPLDHFKHVPELTQTALALLLDIGIDYKITHHVIARIKERCQDFLHRFKK